MNQFWSGKKDQCIEEALRHKRNNTDFQQFVIHARELEFQAKTAKLVKVKTKPQNHLK